MISGKFRLYRDVSSTTQGDPMKRQFHFDITKRPIYQLFFVLSWLFALEIMYSTNLYAQTVPPLAWSVEYDSGYSDSVRKIATDSAGNVYVTGSSSLNGKDYDITTIKYDSSGNQIWIARYVNGSPGDIVTDSTGSVWVSGTSFNGINYDLTTIKYDQNGNQLWADKSINGNATAIAVDLAGNVYVTGFTSNGSNDDYVTLKLDTYGTRIWMKTYDNGGTDHSIGISIDRIGNIYITGSSYGTGTGQDFATIKYSNSGDRLWLNRYNGPASGDDYPVRIVSDALGNTYVTGSSNIENATIKYDPSGNQLWVARNVIQNADLAIDSAGSAIVFGCDSSAIPLELVKYDSNGNQLWFRHFANGFPHNVLVDPSGNIYVTETSSETTSLLGITTIKLDSSGNQIWKVRFNNGFNDWPMALAFDPLGNLLITGVSNHNALDYLTLKYKIAPDLFETNMASPALGTLQNPGASFAVSDTVSNQGNSPAGSFSVGIFLSPIGQGQTVFLGSRFVSGLASGAASTATTSVKLPANTPGGTYYLQAIADYTNQIVESDETNNALTNSSGVISVAPADLVMTSVGTPATNLVKGGAVSVTYTVKNLGSNGASAFYIGLYLSTDSTITTTDKLLGTVYMKNGLAGGASFGGTVSLIIPGSTTPGSYFLGAYSDFSNKVPEGNETNNGLAMTTAIQVH